MWPGGVPRRATAQTDQQRRRSTVDLAHIDVDRPEYRDEIGDLPAADHEREGTEVDEGRAAPLHPRRVDTAARLHVAADRTLGPLHLDVRLPARRRLDLLGLLAHVGGNLTQQVEALQDDAPRLEHLIET